MAARMVLLSLILLAAFGLLLHAAKPESTPVRESFSDFPMDLGSWVCEQTPEMDSRVLAVLGVDDYISRYYSSSDQSAVGLYVGYYKSQREGRTIHSPLNCMPGAGWNPVKRGVITVPIESAPAIRINSLVIAKGNEKQQVLYWYQSHGRVIASEYWGKIYTVLDALRTNRTDAALVRVITPLEGAGAEFETSAEQRCVDFVRTLFPVLRRFLPI
jgi:EpsI family protein